MIKMDSSSSYNKLMIRNKMNDKYFFIFILSIFGLCIFYDECKTKPLCFHCVDDGYIPHKYHIDLHFVTTSKQPPNT
ncbi:hypothetical protein DERF_008649 [Dermatophagoides farinae]|uniref:Uncharacterized protein n=1 Tax=Dermatophagoides farinae TaxID=6954 RepID=A0A922I0T7_DERFA|nr:hypothetical protein DERF_008649 [Dermatophagoides farinae]